MHVQFSDQGKYLEHLDVLLKAVATGLPVDLHVIRTPPIT